MVVAPVRLVRRRAIGCVDPTSRCTQRNVECISLIPATSPARTLDPTHQSIPVVKDKRSLFVSCLERTVGCRPRG